jgi:hypothetical protein
VGSLIEMVGAVANHRVNLLVVAEVVDVPVDQVMDHLEMGI